MSTSETLLRILEKVFDRVFHSPIIGISVLLTSTVLLFLNDKLLSFLHIRTINKTYEEVIGVVFIFSSFVFLLGSIQTIYKRVQVRQNKIREQNEKFINWEDLLTNLTNDEQHVFLKFIKERKRICRINTRYNNINTLVDVGMIVSIEEYIHDDKSCRCKIDDWVYEYLLTHPEVFDPQLRKYLEEN